MARALMSLPYGPALVQTPTPAETVEAEEARPARMRRGRRRRMRSCVAFFMVPFLRDNQDVAATSGSRWRNTGNFRGFSGSADAGSIRGVRARLRDEAALHPRRAGS